MNTRRLRFSALPLLLLALPACQHKEEKSGHEQHRIIVTGAELKDVVVTQQYVCQIQARKHINIRALQDGYLEEIPIKEGQAVKKGELLFKIVPTIYQARLETELAEAAIARLELSFTKKLFEDKKIQVVSENEVALYQARLAKAEAKAKLAQAELSFASIYAPFDGIVDRLQEQQGSLIKEKDILTTLSDNSTMWVYFNVPEAGYLEYMGGRGRLAGSSKIELVDAKIELLLANGATFQQSAGNSLTVEGQFNNETGNIAFRADFPNPDRLLRHGQTGTVRIRRPIKNAIVIPQRATFEILDKQYVWVVGADRVAHQRLITVQREQDDIFVIESGLKIDEKIVLEGVRQVRDGDTVEFEFEKPGEAMKHLKHHAE